MRNAGPAELGVNVLVDAAHLIGGGTAVLDVLGKRRVLFAIFTAGVVWRGNDSRFVAGEGDAGIRMVLSGKELYPSRFE
ncbi:hypothetical protein D3C77_710750 [compost metagenome]